MRIWVSLGICHTYKSWSYNSSYNWFLGPPCIRIPHWGGFFQTGSYDSKYDRSQQLIAVASYFGLQKKIREIRISRGNKAKICKNGVFIIHLVPESQPVSVGGNGDVHPFYEWFGVIQLKQPFQSRCFWYQVVTIESLGWVFDVLWADWSSQHSASLWADCCRWFIPNIGQLPCYSYSQWKDKVEEIRISENSLLPICGTGVGWTLACKFRIDFFASPPCSS